MSDIFQARDPLEHTKFSSVTSRAPFNDLPGMFILRNAHETGIEDGRGRSDCSSPEQPSPEAASSTVSVIAPCLVSASPKPAPAAVLQGTSTETGNLGLRWATTI